ncbi:MAG: hypothetical protein ACLFR5_01840 [Halobacteriales archaeon]
METEESEGTEDGETAYVAVAPRRSTDEYDPVAMGVAVVAVLYEDTVYYFRRDELARLFDLLASVDRVVGVNDYVVDALEPHGDFPRSAFVGVQKRISDALGERVSLNNAARATLGVERDDPRRLPLEWQEGREKTVKRALRKDLMILRDLDEAMRAGKVWVTDPRTMEERVVEPDYM